MAGLNQIPGVGEQIGLVAHLRWLLFKNSLRNIKGRLEAVSSGILWLMMTGVVFGGGIFFGIATYFVVSEARWSWLAGLLWIVFVFWQLYPIFAASTGAQFDFSNLLRFPLRFPSFLILSLVYGLFDPGAVASLVWLLAMCIGLTFARPAMFAAGFLALLAFAAVNLFFARMVFAWIEKWLARRRTREILGFIFVLIILLFQFIGPLTEHWQHSHAHLEAGWITALLAVAGTLPPGLAAGSLELALASHFFQAARSLLFLLLYAALFFWLFRLRISAQFHGENLGETSAPATAAPARPSPWPAPTRSAASWDIPGLSRPVSALFEKEIRYAMRSGIMLLNLIVPVFVVIILGAAPHNRNHNSDVFFSHAQQTIFPLAVAYILLIQVNWAFNSFAFEGTGIQFLFLAPVRFSSVMISKNLFLGLVTAVEALLVWAAFSFIFAPPPLMVVAASFAGLLYATVANCSIGNILSIRYPRRLEFGVFRQKKQAGITIFIGLIAQAVLIGLGVIVFVLARVLHRPSLAIPVFLAFAAIAFLGYRASLSRVDRLAMSHREALTAELCRQG